MLDAVIIGESFDFWIGGKFLHSLLYFEAVTAAADQGITTLCCNFDEIILSFLAKRGKVSE